MLLIAVKQGGHISHPSRASCGESTAAKEERLSAVDDSRKVGLQILYGVHSLSELVWAKSMRSFQF